VGRPPQELMRDGAEHPSVRLSDLTMDWGFRPHTILLRKERKEGVVDRGELGKREKREERLSSWVRGRTKKQACSGRREWLAGLYYKLINEVDE
jgi:hypothetical protein